MEGKNFKATNIEVRTRRGRSPLIAAFNEWAEKERPAAIVHVHYYSDPDSGLRGYQIIYEEASPKENSSPPARVQGQKVEHFTSQMAE